MAEETSGAGGNLLKEFQGAKPPEKAVIIIGIIAVVGIAFYLYKKGTSGQNASSPVQTSAGQVAGYPTAGGLPVLPPGVNPIFDPNGNPIAFQNPGATTPPTTTPPPSGGTGGTTPSNWYTSILGKLGYNVYIRPGGIDANGQRFWIGKTGNSSMFYAPPGSTINQGAAGRVWITPPGGQQQLLTGSGLTSGGTTLSKMPISTVK